MGPAAGVAPATFPDAQREGADGSEVENGPSEFLLNTGRIFPLFGSLLRMKRHPVHHYCYFDAWA